MQSLENYAKATSTLVGPWGGQEGHHWDDGVHSTIRQLEIAHGAAIDSIRIEYDNNGRSAWSEKHGGYGGTTVDKIRLQYPDEYLISLQGHYGSLQEHGPVFIRSLTFESNKGKIYGPYGVERGTLFTLPKNDRGKIVGFLGKSGWYLDAIGAYVEPPHNNLTNVAPSSMVQAQYQQHVVHGSEKYEYSMIQSSLGTNYDLIVAVKQRNDTTNPTPIIPPNKTSHNIKSHTEHKNEVPSVIPPKIEKVPSKRIKEVFTRGPWGGNGGSPFDDGIYDGIRQINVSRNVGIVYIRACYERDGHHVWGNKNGGTGGYKSDKVVIDYPSEILTHITGYHGPIMGMDVIKSLTFHTTKGKHGPYGEEQGEFFSTKSKEGSMIVGFHGRKGLFLDAIGVHLLEGKSFDSTPNKLAPSPPVKTNNQTTLISHKADDSAKTNNQTALVANKVDNSPKFNHQMALVPNKLDDSPKTNYQMASVPSNADNSQWHFKIGKRGQNEEAAHRMVKNPAPCGPGPWGGDGGKQWDDGVYTGIKQIILTLTDAICCIEIEYDRNGQALWSVKHGGSGGGGQAVNRVKLDYPHEVLTCISGYYGSLKKDQGTKVVKSLTFHTSRKKYGPFGEELGTYFESGRTEGKVVGFHGRSSMYLDAIGVHMQHWLGNQKTKPSSLMKMFS